MTALPDGGNDRSTSRLLLSPQLWLAVAVLCGCFIFTQAPLARALVTFACVTMAVNAILQQHDRQQLHASTDEEVKIALENTIVRARAAKRPSGALLVELDGFSDLSSRYGQPTLQQLQIVAFARLRSALRKSDSLLWVGPGRFAVVLSPTRRPDLESVLQLASMLQQTVMTPLTVGGEGFHLTAAVGCCLTQRLPQPSGNTAFNAASLALEEALSHGPAAIRCYTSALSTRAAERNELQNEIIQAMEKGEIRAFFQPQVSIRTGAITGFEALARWQHPTRGLIPPAQFIPVIEPAGLIGILGERILRDSLDMISEWQREGYSIGHVGVNFSTEELKNPQLVEQIGREIDQRGLSADRLAVEVLETVVASRSDEAIIANLTALARLGCCIDLDDFGTGHASITNIRRFSIERIKIDRSFVTGIDKDAEKRSMVAAILTMAERLGLETLAEGAETEGELHALTQLGCGHVQGFAIARAMPREETLKWISAYQTRRNPAEASIRRAV